MYAAERQQHIMDEARRAGRVEVSSLAEVLDVTPETVRRDLGVLERRGALHRVHGGAIPVERLELEPTLAARTTRLTAEKRRIAARALDELPREGTILLDAGTTTLAIVELLPPAVDLTVLTNSLAAASLLLPHPGVTLYLLGGRVRGRTGAAVGDWATSALQGVYVDLAFMGTNGFTAARGLTTPDQAEASVKRAMIAAARRTVVVSDSSKSRHVHFHRFADMADVSMLITDGGLDDEAVAELEEAGTEVVRT